MLCLVSFLSLLNWQIVSLQSATLLNKRMMFLNADHSGLNKFSGKDDENFTLVLPEIQKMVRDGPSIVAERYRGQRKVTWLCKMIQYS